MAELTQEHFEEYMDSFAKIVKGGFDSTDEQFVAVRKDITTMKGDITTMKGDITTMKGDITTIKATMVTKDYLDDKLADLRGDLTILMRKEDTKLKKLVEKLHAKRVLDDADVRDLAQMEPFPALAL